MNVKKLVYISLGVILCIFSILIFSLQIYFGDNSINVNSRTVYTMDEDKSIIDSIYVDWWDSSLKKISSQGVRDVYEIKNTYENLNIVIRENDILRDIILREIIIDGKPVEEYNFNIVSSKEGKDIIKIPISEFDKGNTNKITKVINIYNRYDNVFYNIELDSFEFRFNFSKDSDYLYLNFENYISNFYDEEFKIESNSYESDEDDIIYNFGHINKSIKMPLHNKVHTNVDSGVRDLLFKDTTNFTLYNRFSNPIMTLSVTPSGDLKILSTYSLSNVYESELKNQVFSFTSKEDNIFKVEKKEDGSVDILNLIDNYRVYFDKDLLKTYRVDEKQYENIKGDLINFKIYRDLRDGRYVFTPNTDINTYKFYNIRDNKFLSYDEGTKEFISKDTPSEFILTNDNKLFDIYNRVFVRSNIKNNKNTYVGDKEYSNGDVFKFNDMSASIFKKVSYDEIQQEILSSNYIQVMFKNKETHEFLQVNPNSNEALNGTLYNDSYLSGEFNYKTGIESLNNFIFEIRPNNQDFTTFNLYNKLMGTSINTDYGFVNNKLIFDKGNDNKVSFILEKNNGLEDEFKIKDDYGSYLSFQESDDYARVTSSGFMKKFFNSDDDLDVFEIYMIDFNTLDFINSGDYISLSSSSQDNKFYLDKVSQDNKVSLNKSLDEYIVFRNKQIFFLEGDNLMDDMIATINYSNLRGIHSPLTTGREGTYSGYRFRILNEINGIHD